MDEQLLKDFLETAKQNQYNWDVIMPKFPELEGIDLQLLKDYTETAIKYNYDYDIINPKFPEFFGEQNEVKKKIESDFISQDQDGVLVTEDISSDIPVYDFEKPQTEQDFFEGTFGDILRSFDKFTQTGLGDFIDDMARSAATGYYQGQVAEDASDILIRGANATDEDIYSFIEANKEAQKLGPSDEMMAYQKTYEENGKGFMGVVMGLYESGLQVIPEVIVSSMFSMATNKDSLVAAGTVLGAGATVGGTTGAAGGTAVLPVIGTVGGAAGGAIAGAAATLPYAFAAAGSVLEMGATFSELLQEEIEGELTPEKIREAINNEEIYTSIRNKALARGITIGVIDAFTGRLGSKVAGGILSKAGKGATKGTKIKSVLAASGVESVGGSIGESAGIGVTNIDLLGKTKGQEFDISEIALEGIAEAPGGIKDVISARFSKPKYKVNGKKVDVETIDNLIETMTLDQLQSTKINIDNDYEGRADKLSDRILQLNTERLILDANPDINPETLSEITKLQLELSSLEGNKTEVAKEKASILKAKIKDLQENQLEAEVDTEVDAFRELEQSEQLKYIEQASKELVEESEAKGDEEFEITEQQNLERAVELFNKDQQTDTEAEVETKAEPEDEVDVDDEVVYEMNKTNKKIWSKDFEILDNRQGQEQALFDEEGNKTSDKWWVVNKVTGQIIEVGTKTMAKDVIANAPAYAESFGDGTKVGADMIVTPSPSPAPAPAPKAEVKVEAEPEAEATSEVFKDEQVILKEEVFSLTEPDGSKYRITLRTNLDGSFQDGINEVLDANGEVITTFRFKIDEGTSGISAEESFKKELGSRDVFEKIQEKSGKEVNSEKIISSLTTDQKKKLGIKTPAPKREVKVEEQVEVTPEGNERVNQVVELSPNFREDNGEIIMGGLSVKIKDLLAMTDDKFNAFVKDVTKKFKLETPATPQTNPEISRLENEIENDQMSAETILEEITIEQDNYKEEVARIKEEKAKIKKDKKLSKEQKLEAIEEKVAEQEDLKDERDGIIESYRDDLKQKKSEIRKAKKALEKITQKPRKQVTKVEKQIDNARKALNKLDKEIKIVVHNDDASYRKATGEDTREQSTRGEYNPATKTIHINATKVQDNTVAHEVFHALLLRNGITNKQAKAITDRMLKAVKKTASPELLQKLKEHSDNYDSALQSEESIAELFGILASEYKSLDKPTQNLVQRWVNKLAKILGVKKFTDAEVIDLLNVVSAKVEAGVRITEQDVKILDKNKSKKEIINSRKQTFSKASSVEMFENPEILQPKREANGRTKVIELGRAFDKRAKDNGYYIPIPKNGVYTDSQLNKIAEAMTDDAQLQLLQDDSGIGWYDLKTRSAMELMSRIHPELSDSNSKPHLEFTLMVALISQNNSVGINFRQANEAYTYYKNNNKLPNKPYAGKSGNIIKQNIALAFEAIKKKGWKKYKNTLQETKTVKEWEVEGYKVNGENKTTKITGAMAMLGSKIGSFWGNLNGDFNTLTADLWFSRMFNRYTGNVVAKKATEKSKQTTLDELKKYKGKTLLNGYKKSDILKGGKVFDKWLNTIVKDYADGGYKDKQRLNIVSNTHFKNTKGELQDIPRGGKERNTMRDVVKRVQDKLIERGYPKLDIADIQAIVWYNEKDLYRQYKAVNKSSEKTDYETAAQEVLREQGVNAEVALPFKTSKSSADGGRKQTDRIQPKSLSEKVEDAPQSRKQKTIQQAARDFNMSETGFFPPNADSYFLKRAISRAEGDYGVKKARTGSFFLVDSRGKKVNDLFKRPQSRKQIIGENADLTALNLSYGLNLAKDIESFLKLTPEQIEKGASKNVPIDIRFLKNKTPQELKLLTGWERGKDNKWRYEIPDGKLTLRESGTFKLSDIYDSKDLYKAYPQLKDMKVEVDIRPQGAVNAWFIPSDKSIEINAKPDSDVTSLLVHEIQHAIQFIEGFATGGNMVSAFNAYESTVTPEEKRAELELKEEVEVLRNLSAVLELASIDFEGMSLDEVLDLDFMKENFDVLGLEEVGDAVNVYEYVNVDNPQIINKLKTNEFGDSLDLEESFEEASFIAGEKQAEYSDKYSTYALYQRLTGEVESRNVEKRYGMREEKRRETLLEATEDVAREDQILLFPDAPQSRKQKPSGKKKPTRKRTSSIKKAITEIKNVLKITPDEQRKIFKALNDQKKRAKDIKKDIVASLRELTKEGKLTPSKMVSVINKVPDDFNNPITVERFVEYMTKVFNDADYGNKMMIANAKKGKARKNVSTKLGIAEGLVEQLQRLFSVKPSLIPDSVLDQYMELINIFGKRETVLSLPPMEQVIQLTEDVLQQLDEEQSMAIELADRYENAEKVMGDNGVDYAATIKQMLDNEVITEREYEVMKKYKSQIKPAEPATPKTEAEIEAERQEVIKDVKATKEVDPSVFPSRLERDLAKRFKKLLKTDAINDLSLDDLKNLFKVIDNINNGYLPHYAQIMVGKMNAINDAKVGTNAIKRSKLLPLSKIYAKIKSKIGRTGKSPTLELIRRNPTFYIDQVFGDFKTKDIFNSIFKRSAEASAKYTKAIKEVQAKIEKVEQAVFKSFGRNPNKVIMSKYKQMSYLIQQEFLSNPDSNQVNSVEDFLKATIKRIKTETTSYTETDAKMLQEILDKYTANGTKPFDIDQLYESFNVAERNSIRTLEEINKSMTDKAVYTANIIRGNKITPLKNYTHLSVIPDVSKADIIETETSQISDMFNKYLKPSTKAKSLIERTGKVSPLNFDVYASVQRGAKYTLMDFNLTEPIRTARRTLNQIEKNLSDEDGNMSVNDRRKFNAIRDASVESIENLLSNALTQNTIADQAVDYIQKQGYRAILAGIPRASYELLSNILAGIYIDPKGIISGIKNRKLLASPEGKEVMNNLNSTQTNRVFSTGLSGKFVDTGILNQAAGVTASRAKGKVQNTILQLWNKTGQRWIKGVEFTADSLISAPDKLVMQPMWFGAFENRFKQLTGKSPDFDKIAANDEAYMNKYATELNDAKTLADNRSVAMGATDNAFMGILKGTVKPNQGILLRGFNAFNGFMTRFLIFEYITARTGIMAAVGNGQVSKKQGAALLAGVTTRMIAYTFMGTLVAEAIKDLTEDDDDEDFDFSNFQFEDNDEQGMKSVDKMLGQAMVSAFTSLLFGRDFGNATKSIINLGLENLNEAYGQFLRDGEYDKYRDAIQYTIIPEGKNGRLPLVGDVVPNLFAAYSPMIKTTVFGLNKIFESDRVEPDAIERQQDERFIRLPLETFGVLGFIPFYKDIRKIVLGDMYKGLRKAKKDAANKKKRKAEMLQGYSSETDMKRYDFPLWERTFGPDSPGYETRQVEKELKRKARKLRQQEKDKMYDYTPSKKKRRKQSSPFGPSSNRKGSSPFGPN